MARLTAIQCLTLSLFLVSSVAFTTISRNAIRSNIIKHSARSNILILSAKKAKVESKGFSPKKVKVIVDVDADTQNFGEGLVPSSSPIIGTSKAVVREKQGLDGETDADAIFKKYGIKDGESQKTKSASKKKKTVTKNRKGEVEEAPFGQSVLANISADAQMKIDNTLVACVSAALGFVVLCGIAISLGAYTIVFPEVKIPESVDFAIKNFLSPAFTPALGIFFFFSTTFGLFKFAQISSDQTVYKEEVTRDL